MPYELPLPNALKQWKVKIFDNELLCEEPHATIIFKMERWRFSLRRGKFLDEKPNPSAVPSGVVAEVVKNMRALCREWDARFPTNPVTALSSEEE